MKQTTFTSVLPVYSESNFEVSSCRMTIVIDEKILEGVYTLNYKLKKITDSQTNDDWIEGTSSNAENCSLISVKNDDDGGSFQSQLLPNEDKLAFHVEFLKCVPEGEEIAFSITYKRKLLRKEVEKGFMFNR